MNCLNHRRPTCKAALAHLQCANDRRRCCVRLAAHTSGCPLHPNRTLRCQSRTVGVALHLHLVGLQRRAVLRSEALGVAAVRDSLGVGCASFCWSVVSPVEPRSVRTGGRRLAGACDQGVPTNVYCGSSVAALRPSAMSSSSGNGGVRNPASTARCATLSNRRIAVLAALARVSVAISA